MNRYVVFDLEMCPVPQGDKQDAFGHDMELIEIGAVLLDEGYVVLDCFKTYVKPEYGQITPFIRRLTRITEDDVKDAPTAKEALTAFTDWIPQDAVPVSWSGNDEYQLRKEMRGKRIDLPRLRELLSGVMDCQALFSEKLESAKKYKLTEALAIADIDYDESIHEALTDAHNTALLFAKIQREETLSLSRYYSSDSSSRGSFLPFEALLADYITTDE